MDKTFPDRLRKFREYKGLSQTELAEKTGLQPSAISHFETGKRAPSFDNLKRLADALDVTVDYLLGRTEEPAAAGPRAQKLFRDFTRMSADDQESLARFAEMLGQKNRDRKEEK